VPNPQTLSEEEELEFEMELEKERGATSAASKFPSYPEALETHRRNLEAQGQTLLEPSETPTKKRILTSAPPPMGEQFSAFMGAPMRMAQGIVGIAKDIGRMDQPLEKKLAGYGQQLMKTPFGSSVITARLTYDQVAHGDKCGYSTRSARSG